MGVYVRDTSLVIENQIFLIIPLPLAPEFTRRFSYDFATLNLNQTAFIGNIATEFVVPLV